MASINAANEPNATSPISTSRLALHGLVALVAACTANVLVLLVSMVVIEFPSEFVGGPFGPLAVGPVVVNSAVAVVGATLAYGVIARYSARPNRTFVIVAGGVLVVSFAMFLAPDIAGAPLELFAVLAVMHVVAAIVIVSVLTRASNVEATSR